MLFTSSGQAFHESQCMQTNSKYMMQSMKSTFITFLPIILIFGWMNANIAYEPLFPNEEFTIDAVFNRGAYKLFSLFEFLSLFFLFILSKKVLFCSNDLTKFFKRIFFFKKNKIFFLPSTIPTKLFKPNNKKTVRKKLGFKDDERIIIFVGRIGYLKGLDFILNAP